MERVPRDAYDRDQMLKKDDLEVGRTYIFSWNPYAWAVDNEGMEGKVRVTVEETRDISGDVTLRTDDGTRLKDLGEGRPQVMGPAENTDDIPDWTDVGTGGVYYRT